MFVATKYYLTSGIGVDKYDIASFDKALVMAGLADYNLVKVSSIIPPNSKQYMFVDYPKGSILYTAYSTKSTQEDIQIASAIVAAIPKDKELPGVIMEYSCVGKKDKAIDTAKELAIEAIQRRGVDKYDIIANGIDAQGKNGLVTTTLCAIALM